MPEILTLIALGLVIWFAATADDEEDHINSAD